MSKSMKGVPLKTTTELDFSKVLRNHIRRAGSNEDEALQALSILTKSRNTAVVVFPDRTEIGLNILQRYYDHFVSMERRFPVTGNNEIRVSFTWRDAFGKGVFGGKKTLTNSGFERAAVLFNVAAFMTQIASSIRSTDDASMQTAMKHYQQACGIFEYLRDNASSLIGQMTTADLTSEFLGFLAALCQAQAQECVWIKAVTSGKMKPKVLSQVTAGCADLYEIAHAKAETQKSVSSVLKDEYAWLSDISVKVEHYRGLSHYYMGKELRRVRDSPGAEMKYGEEIARYQLAESFMKYKSSIDLLPNNIKNDIKSELNVAVKDNNLIYHDPIPDMKTLAAPDKAILAKPIAFDPTKPLSKEPKDLFGSITPIAVANALDFFKQKRTELVSSEVARIREANDTLNGVLASLNLPAALEETKSGELPSSLWEKAVKLQNQGGISYVRRFISDLPELLERNKEILDESMRMLKDEREQDEKLRTQYKDKWNRTPSEQLTKQLAEDQLKYQTLLQRSREADAKVKTQFENTVDYMQILSLSKAEIEAKLPSAQTSDGLKSSEAQQLRELMKEVDSIKVHRSRIEESLQKQPDTDIIKTQFLGEMSPEGSVDAASITERVLNELYGAARAEFGETVANQEQVLQQVQSVHARFSQFNSGGNNEVRDEFLRKMAQAYDAFETLVNHLNEGQKFYGDLTEILLTHQSKVTDFVFARSTEKEDLLKGMIDITSNATKTAGQPNAPSYHANISATTETSSQPSGGAPQQAPGVATAPPSSNVQQPPYSMNAGTAPTPTPMPSYNPYMPMTHQNHQSVGSEVYGQQPTYPGYGSATPYGMPPQQPMPGSYPYPPPPHAHPQQQPTPYGQMPPQPHPYMYNMYGQQQPPWPYQQQPQQ